MIVFIDESGIHKAVGHSTIALVYLEVLTETDFDEYIKGIEKDLGIREFHWADYGSKRGWMIRKKFVEKISKLDFHFKVAILNNPINMSLKMENILDYLLVEKNVSKIVIDGKHPTWYRRRIKSGLRRKGISVKKLQTANDKSSGGLRLADCLAGLIRSHWDNPTELTKKLFKLVENKITALAGGQEIR